MDEDSSSQGESLLARVTRLTLNKYGYVFKSIVNSRILTLFKSKMYRVEQALKKVNAGGRQLIKLIESWKTGKNSVWKFKIYYSEVDHTKLMEMEDNEAIKSENNSLRNKKRKAEEDLNLKGQKLRCLEKKLNTALSQVKGTKATLKQNKKRFQQLTRKLIKQQKGQSEKARGPSNKKFSSYTRQHQ